jgi:phospholipase D-like protein
MTSKKPKASKTKRATASKARDADKAKTTKAATVRAFARVVEAIRKHGHKLLSVPHVNVGPEDIRPGYQFRNGKITNTAAIVVSIHPRDRNKKGRLPKKLGGVPVRVKIMTPLEQLEKISGGAASAVESDAPIFTEASQVNELALPAWDLMESENEANNVAVEEDTTSKPKPKYTPHPDELIEIKDAMNVLCHVSPEEGWNKLSKFLTQAKDDNQNVTIAMYDLTAPHVLKKLNSVMKGSKKQFRLILDPKVSLDGAVKVNDVREEEVRDTLTKTAGEKFDFLWAAVKTRGKVSQGLFPTAYHIKVVVRGGKAFWMSSGNMQSSNQPDLSDIDLTNQKVLAKTQKTYNREWHVIVDHPELAAIYEKFIRRDMKEARPLQATEADVQADESLLAPPELLIDRDVIEDVGTNVSKRQAFPPAAFAFTKDKPLQVQPVLTPDNYDAVVLPVIKSAKKRLYFQNQYIKVGKNPGDQFTKLLDALLKKIKAKLDVKIILRSLPNAGDELEALKYYAATKHGITDLPIKYQDGSHTKGIIVDSKNVVVGSHNWSEQGVTVNRDASLIFFNPDIASYYEKIFNHDWQFLAKPKVFSDEEMPMVVFQGAGEAAEADTPSSLMRVPWDFFEDAS